VDSDQIKSRLEEAIEIVKEKDYFLLEYAVHERSICHRLAVYLEQSFTGFNVDCEYDNDLDSESGRKRVKFPDGSTQDRVFPDIIVHERGKNGPDSNLLVAEMKKYTDVMPDLEEDRNRLHGFVAADEINHLCYRVGALVLMGIGESAGKSRVEWITQER